jgi:MFS family permease
VTAPGSPRPRVPSAVWALGFVSLLMDASSELVHSLLPLFLVGVLGASATMLGLIEGVAEATAMIVKVFSGTLSDIVRRRKPLVVLGYGLAAVAKPLFALAGTVGLVFTARFLDRIGKGIRGAPRDALIQDVTPPEVRGAAFGLRQSLDTVGAVAGPLLAVALLFLLGGDLRAALWFAVLPAVASVLVLLFAVHEPVVERAAARARFQLSGLRRLPAAFWVVVAIGAALTLARFSEAFLILRAQDVGMALTVVPVVMVAMSVVYSLSAYPVGVLSDRVGRGGLLGLGFVVLIIADVVLALAAGPWAVLLGAGLWGLHMGLTQGLLSAMVADTAPRELSGSAFGLFNLASGVALLLASAIAGILWDSLGPAATFAAGAGFTVAALAGLVSMRAFFQRR